MLQKAKAYSKKLLHRNKHQANDTGPSRPVDVPQKSKSEAVPENSKANSEPKATTTITDLVAPSPNQQQSIEVSSQEGKPPNDEDASPGTVDEWNYSCKVCLRRDNAKFSKDLEGEAATNVDYNASSTNANNPGRTAARYEENPKNLNLWERAFEQLNNESKENLRENKDTKPEQAIGESTESNPDALFRMLKEQGGHIQACQIIAILVDNGYFNRNSLGALLEKGLIEIDANLLEAVAPNDDLLAYVYATHQNIPVTPKAIFRACKSPENLGTLLAFQDDYIALTEELLLAALDSPLRNDFVRCFFEYERMDEWDVSITEGVLEKAVLTKSLPALKFICSQNKKNIEQAWQDVWRHKELSFGERLNYSDILLRHGKLDVSQTLLDFVPQEDDREGLSSKELDLLADMCIHQEISVPAMDMLMPKIFGRGNDNTIRGLINLAFNLKVTDYLVDCAERNKYLEDKDGLVADLEKRAAEDQSYWEETDEEV